MPHPIDAELVAVGFHVLVHQLKFQLRGQKRCVIVAVTDTVRGDRIIREQRVPMLTGTEPVHLSAQRLAHCMGIEQFQQHTLAVIFKGSFHSAHEGVVANFKAGHFSQDRILSIPCIRALPDQLLDTAIFIDQFMRRERLAPGVTNQVAAFARNPGGQLFNVFVQDRRQVDAGPFDRSVLRGQQAFHVLAASIRVIIEHQADFVSMSAIVGCQRMHRALQAAGPGIRGLRGCRFVGVTKTAGNGIHRAVIAIVVDQYIRGIEGWVASAIVVRQTQYRVQVAIVGQIA
ncbi:hypothetical protein ALO50_200109 [Pseudomonas syringae pv. cerasicola]|uniref:Addiction module antitoxin n=1 Tax=Pseudomonas syringae pv. cerasicola TaxID=264451 RepID=A0A0P9NAE3_PSESX|nr:hypothetical protein ALO50_200109 [Pseudomonas syringae pv. cerasicola]